MYVSISHNIKRITFIENKTNILECLRYFGIITSQINTYLTDTYKDKCEQCLICMNDNIDKYILFPCIGEKKHVMCLDCFINMKKDGKTIDKCHYCIQKIKENTLEYVEIINSDLENQIE